MKLACESFAKEVLPSVRAILAKRMIDDYNLSQTVTARRLGLSQPAVSQYRKNLRGYRINEIMENRKASSMIKELAEKVARRKVGEEEFNENLCGICCEVTGITCHHHRKHLNKTS